MLQVRINRVRIRKNVWFRLQKRLWLGVGKELGLKLGLGKYG